MSWLVCLYYNKISLQERVMSSSVNEDVSLLNTGR